MSFTWPSFFPLSWNPVNQCSSACAAPRLNASLHCFPWALTQQRMFVLIFVPHCVFMVFHLFFPPHLISLSLSASLLISLEIVLCWQNSAQSAVWWLGPTSGFLISFPSFPPLLRWWKLGRVCLYRSCDPFMSIQSCVFFPCLFAIIIL